MTKIWGITYSRYKRSNHQIKRDETQLSAPFVDSRICTFPSLCTLHLFSSFLSAKIYRHKAYLSCCCCSNWPHRTIQTTRGSLWLSSISEIHFILDPGELQKEVNSVLIWREAISPLLVCEEWVVLRMLLRAWEPQVLAQGLLTKLRVSQLWAKVEEEVSF